MRKRASYNNRDGTRVTKDICLSLVFHGRKKRKKSIKERREGREGVREGRRQGRRQRQRKGKRRTKEFSRAWPTLLSYAFLESLHGINFPKFWSLSPFSDQFHPSRHPIPSELILINSSVVESSSSWVVKTPPLLRKCKRFWKSYEK